MMPGQAAKQWAKEHPEASGRILVWSWTPVGRGGWMTKRKTTTFFVLGGEAAQTRDDYQRHTFNGICQACGATFLEPTLTNCYGPDPDAGKPVDYAYATPAVVGAWAWLTACPECIERLGLRTEYYPGGWAKDNSVYELIRKHPTLAQHDAGRWYQSLVAKIDLTQD